MPTASPVHGRVREDIARTHAGGTNTHSQLAHTHALYQESSMRYGGEISLYPPLDPETETTPRAPMHESADPAIRVPCARFVRPCRSPVAVHARALSAASRVVG
jgi:hypothetical protein